MEQNSQDQLRSVVEESLANAQVPGAAVAVWVDGQACFEAGIGYRDSQQEIPLSKDASFYIYSITKSLIATASLHLVKEECLDLDAPVKTYLTDLPLNITVTPRQLLSHTSGLPDYGRVPAYFEAVRASPGSPWSAAAFLELIQTQESQFPPGTGWGYSNIGYLLMKLTLEKITDLPLGELLEKVIFEPLSLEKTFVPATLADSVSLTPGYSTLWSEDKLQDVAHLYHPGWVSHGVVISTAPELASIIDTLLLGEIFDTSLVNQMSHPIWHLGKFPLFTNLGYGLGLFVDKESSYGQVTGHTGEGPGYSVAAFHFSDLAGSRATIVVLANRDKHDYGLALVYKMAGIIAQH